MITTKARDQKIDELRRQLEAAEAEKAAQEKLDKAWIARVQKVVGENHSHLVLALYELLGIQPEHTTTRIVKGEVRDVAVDKDEKIRTQRLFDMVSALVDAADASLLDDLRLADDAGRDERRPKPKKAKVISAEPTVEDTAQQESAGVPAALSYPRSA